MSANFLGASTALTGWSRSVRHGRAHFDQRIIKGERGEASGLNFRRSAQLWNGMSGASWNRTCHLTIISAARDSQDASSQPPERRLTRQGSSNQLLDQSRKFSVVSDD
jgi:hypothetical protein